MKGTMLLMIKQRETYKFCTNCQTELKAQSDFKECLSCGKHYYFNAKPTIALILTDQDDKLLLTKRAHEPFKGWWDLPGGFVEEDETLEQAAQRELKEETGVSITDFSYIGSFKEDYHFRDEIVSVVAAVFTCKLHRDDSITVGDDVLGYKFVMKEDLDYERMAFENQRSFVRNHLK
jgi:NAD+ diphosphatase